MHRFLTSDSCSIAPRRLGDHIGACRYVVVVDNDDGNDDDDGDDDDDDDDDEDDGDGGDGGGD
jgi:hypothetical protein